MIGGISILVSYALGSISSALILARSRGIDLRQEGSGNLGATNAGRALGARAGRTVLLIDVLKGALPAGLAAYYFGFDSPFTAGCGFAAVLGHCFPVWHGFKGGKGAATSAGVLLALSPIAGLGAALCFVLLKKITGRASVGSLVGVSMGLLLTWLMTGEGTRTLMTLAIAALVFLQHRGNIARLLRNEEPRS